MSRAAFAFTLMALVALTPTIVEAATFTVENTNDDGGGSLRRAIQDANASPGADTVLFDAGVSGTITLASSLPTLEDVAIIGPGASALTVSGNGTVRVLEIWAGRRVTISGLTIAHGSNFIAGGIRNLGTLTIANCALSQNSGSAIRNGGIGVAGALTITDSVLSGNSSNEGGGGIYNEAGTVTISRTTLSGNSAATGGGIFNRGTLVISDSTLSGNSSPNGGGGALWNQASATVSNSTLSGNSTSFTGGGIRNWNGDLTLVHSTVSGNSASFTGGGIQNEGIFTVKGSIVANNSSGGDCSGNAPTLVGTNLASDASCAGFTEATPAALQLGPLNDNGGPTATHALLPGSVAIDAAAVCTSATGDPLTADQRGARRPRGPACDVGAFEYGLLVTHTGDSGAGSLREAILNANSAPGPDTIMFLPTVTGTILLVSALPTLTGTVEINGPGADVVTVNGAGLVRVFDVDAGAIATVSGLAIAGGFATTGGGIRNLGTLTLRGSVLSNNGAGSEGGGAISNSATGILALESSTLSGNWSEASGGGIHNAGTLSVVDSTFSGCSAATDGGGIDNVGTATLVHSTLAGNTGASGGGIHNAGTLTVKNSIVADSPGGGCSGEAASALGINLSGDATCPGFTVVAPADLSLGPLANNGGPTPTHALLPGSSAIDTATDCTDTSGEPVSADQRAVPRPQGPACDVGAFEHGFAVTTTNDSGAGSLRQAILDANADPGEDTVVFVPEVNGRIVLASALPDIADDIEIVGPGSGVLSVSGNFAVRVLTIGAGLGAAISGLTITEGASAGNGGGIFNQGTLTLSDVTLSGNTTQGADGGGGIFNDSSGTLTITNCRIASNSAPGTSGGGVLNLGTLTVAGSPFTGNAAWTGGGITNEGSATLTQSTLAFNWADLAGGGLANSGTIVITNTTVSENATIQGGGILNWDMGTVTLVNSTLSDNDATAFSNTGVLIAKNSVITSSSAFDDCSGGGSVTVLGVNFDTDGTCTGFTQVTPAGLGLGPLADNSGATQTHALLPGSLAIDGALDCTDAIGAPITEDQRGIPRPQGTACDIGAYELVPPGSYFTVVPCRLFDSRQPGQGPAVPTGATKRLSVWDRCGLPRSARAILVNVTVTEPTGGGHLQLFPADQAPPTTSVINFSSGQTRANNAIAALANDGSGELAIRPNVGGGGSVHVIIDVSGYFE